MKASGVMLFGGSRAAAFPTTVLFGRGKLTVRCYSSSSPGTANVHFSPNRHRSNYFKIVSWNADHVSFIREVAVTEPPEHLNQLLKMLQVKGKGSVFQSWFSTSYVLEAIVNYLIIRCCWDCNLLVDSFHAKEYHMISNSFVLFVFGNNLVFTARWWNFYNWSLRIPHLAICLWQVNQLSLLEPNKGFFLLPFLLPRVTQVQIQELLMSDKMSSSGLWFCLTNSISCL